MDEDIIKDAEGMLSDARIIASFIGHPGYKVLREIFSRRIEEHSNIDNITSLKDLEATKKARKMVRDAFAELESIPDSGYQANEILERSKRTET